MLKSVDDYEYVRVGDTCIPFVGDETAILTVCSEVNRLLYFNPYVVNGYDIKSNSERNEARRLIFGNEIVEEEQAKDAVYYIKLAQFGIVRK